MATIGGGAAYQQLAPLESSILKVAANETDRAEREGVRIKIEQQAAKEKKDKEDAADLAQYNLEKKVFSPTYTGNRTYDDFMIDGTRLLADRHNKAYREWQKAKENGDREGINKWDSERQKTLLLIDQLKAADEKVAENFKQIQEMDKNGTYGLSNKPTEEKFKHLAGSQLGITENPDGTMKDFDLLIPDGTGSFTKTPVKSIVDGNALMLRTKPDFNKHLEDLGKLLKLGSYNETTGEYNITEETVARTYNTPEKINTAKDIIKADLNDNNLYEFLELDPFKDLKDLAEKPEDLTEEEKNQIRNQMANRIFDQYGRVVKEKTEEKARDETPKEKTQRELEKIKAQGIESRKNIAESGRQARTTNAAKSQLDKEKDIYEPTTGYSRIKTTKGEKTTYRDVSTFASKKPVVLKVGKAKDGKGKPVEFNINSVMIDKNGVFHVRTNIDTNETQELEETEALKFAQELGYTKLDDLKQDGINMLKDKDKLANAIKQKLGYTNISNSGGAGKFNKK